jgi:hypothetical protein
LRTKLIIVGAIGVLAAATLTVNAQTSAHTTASRNITSALAIGARIATDRGDDIAIGVRAATPAATASAKPVSDEAHKPAVPAHSNAPKAALSSACQSAIATLKTMHQADLVEDASERSSAISRSATALAAERAEDLAEAQKWVSALQAARTACLPAAVTACRTAISSLQATLQAFRIQELAEPRTTVELDWASDVAGLRTAFATIASACPVRE